MEQQKIVGIWIRVSTEDQAQGDSPEHHEKRARMYAEAKGWTVAEVYHLEAVSGKSVMEHPEAKRMLKDMKSGHISGLIFSKLARLARNTKELLEFADIFDKHKADLISLGESIDTSTPAGRLFYTMVAATAQFEREEIASRILASVSIRAKLGKPLSGSSPYGFKWVNKEFVVNEDEAPVLKLMYDLFLKLQRKRAVAAELNTMGYRTRNGTLFSGTAVRRTLLDTSAKGIRRANYVKKVGNKSVEKPESEWVIVPCPQIVDEKTWDTANQLLVHQLKTNKKPGRRAVYLLSGFVWCTCGKKMYVFHETNPLYKCHSCGTRIPADDLHDIYYSQLKTFLFAESNASEYLSKANAEIAEKETQFKLLEEEAVKLRKRTTELVDLRISGELSKETFAKQFKPMEERLAQIDSQLPELEGQVDYLKIQSLSSDTVLQEAKDLYTHWPTLSFEIKRGIVERITTSIIVGKENITIKLAYLPTPPTSPQNPVKGEQSLTLRPADTSLSQAKQKATQGEGGALNSILLGISCLCVLAERCY